MYKRFDSPLMGALLGLAALWLLIGMLGAAGQAHANDVGQQPQLLVDGWYGDTESNGVLLQEASVIRDGETVPIVVALAFLKAPGGNEQLVFISPPIKHNIFFGSTNTTFKQVPNGETFDGFLVAFPELQPSPTAFSTIVVGLRILIDDVPTGIDDDGQVVLSSFNLVLERLP